MPNKRGDRLALAVDEGERAFAPTGEPPAPSKPWIGFPPAYISTVSVGLARTLMISVGSQTAHPLGLVMCSRRGDRA